VDHLLQTECTTGVVDQHVAARADRCRQRLHILGDTDIAPDGHATDLVCENLDAIFAPGCAVHQIAGACETSGCRRADSAACTCHHGHPRIGVACSTH